MELLHNAARYKILTPEKELKSQLIRIEKAGRTCYQSFKNEITRESAQKFVSMIMKRGHLSVIEHSNMSVRFWNVSRGFTHEMVRHRLASYSQESTRYVDYARKGDDDVDLDRFQVKIIGPRHKDCKEKIELSEGKKLSFEEMGERIEEFYRSLRKAGWKPEEARQILPIGLKAEIVVSANLRQWHHIFTLRTSKYAHWEIRGVMIELLKEIQPILTPIFDGFTIAGKDKDGNEYMEFNKS
jgi:thymidylate synthase (FAD)